MIAGALGLQSEKFAAACHREWAWFGLLEAQAWQTSSLAGDGVVILVSASRFFVLIVYGLVAAEATETE